MSMNDVVSDLVSRLKNGQQAALRQVRCPASRLVESVLKVLEEEGYIVGSRKEEVRPGVSELIVDLKYYEGQPVIRNMRRISKPGRRVYMPIGKLPRYNNGLGVVIISTSHGVVSDFEARKLNVGGEVLCTVF